VIAISAVLSDCDAIEDMAVWGRTKEAWLCGFLVLTNGVPSEKTFLRIFQAQDPKEFGVAFRRWVAGAHVFMTNELQGSGSRVQLAPTPATDRDSPGKTPESACAACPRPAALKRRPGKRRIATVLSR